ncbi:MAG: hypothetical protein LBT89_02795, partial [Planctomycetaceae bacterium]|nr:hypothetical protein [Planctomycetaceae bacterium]
MLITRVATFVKGIQQRLNLKNVPPQCRKERKETMHNEAGVKTMIQTLQLRMFSLDIARITFVQCAFCLCILWIFLPAANASGSSALVEPLQRIAESTAPVMLNGQGTPLQNTAKTILEALKGQQTPSVSELEKIELAVADWDILRQNWTVQTTTATGDGEEQFIPSKTALDEIASLLQRRLEIWRLVLQCEKAETFPVTQRYGISAKEAERLFVSTGKVVRYIYSNASGGHSRSLAERAETWCLYFDLEAFVADLESVRNIASKPIRRVSLADSIADETVYSLCCRANTIVSRLNSPALSGEQRDFLAHPDILAWKDELQNWTADTVSPQTVLEGLERYDSTGGMTDMKALSLLAGRLAVSKTPAYAHLGSLIERQYAMPNLKIYISQSLVSRHIPPVRKEVARFRDVIQDTPVIGRRQTDTDVKMFFAKDTNRMLFVLGVAVDVETQSRSDAFAAQLYNAGSTSVEAFKGIELTQDGLVFYPCKAQITDSRLRLVDMRTNFDAIPLISLLFRTAVRDQYNSRSGAARSETQRKILRQVRSRLDSETESRFGQFNEKYKAFSHYIGETFGLHITKQDARTEDDWLLSSWSLRSSDTLGSNTMPPETPNGAFADVKLHESLVNLFLGQLGLEGQSGKVRDFKKQLAEKFQQPALAEPADGDDVDIMLATANPLTVRFIDGKIELTIKIAALRMLKQTHRNFKVIVC